ncbi:cystathionine beta-synthase [Natronogracilivirga saccharolytica]|uniref:Cystathionine beta-synthase n=1 Tax=Natronogracilivirga saccharolytica TaxID=2812953 RepID=A0A8J7UV65_9BACT|nr:cystathionine beta-synthase [Natronogracilivirga saccharolytica]MBP3193115.1 cystathionine beta-synthase [Natronogracilivirga saccharolytica]
MWHHSIIDTIGNTPLVKLNTFHVDQPGTVLAKVEYFNPGQSVKDRIALKMIEDAEKRGELKPGGTIIEGTSGNTGMGLALAAAVKGYKCVFTTTDKQSMEKVNLLRALGCEVQICPTNVEPDDPRSYYSVAKRLNDEIPNSFYPDQYNNLSNKASHYEMTGPEIWEQTEGKITHFVAGIGTGGTISGTGQYLKEQNPDIKIIGVDSVGSIFKSYFETGEFDKRHIAPYLTEGIGEDIIPENVDFSLIDDIIQCPDREAFVTTRKLARKEGLFVGGSCGAAVWGAMNYIKKNPLKPDDLMVIILPDSGTRYISKVYNDEWMRTNGFLDDRQVPELDEVIKVNDSRDRGLVTVDMDETLDDAIKRMNDHNISQLPVSSGDKLVGSLTENQILGLLTQQTNVRNKKVGEVMEEPFPVVSADLKVDQITRMLSDGQPAVILRLDDGRHTIITRSDLINAMSKSG